MPENFELTGFSRLARCMRNEQVEQVTHLLEVSLQELDAHFPGVSCSARNRRTVFGGSGNGWFL